MFLGSAAAVFTTSFAALPAACRGKVYPGTTVHGIDLAGATETVGMARLRSALAGFEQTAVSYVYQDQRWDLSLADLGAALDYDHMIDQALMRGRDGTIVDRYAPLVSDQRPVDIPLSLQQDESQLRTALQAIADQIALRPSDATLELKDGAIVISGGKPGRQLDLDSAISATIDLLDRGSHGLVELQTLPIAPRVDTADLVEARDHANRLIGEPIYFSHQGLTYPIDAPSLAGALIIDGGSTARLDVTRLSERFDAIAAAVLQPARNARLGWDDGIWVVERDVDGVQVARAALEQGVLDLAQSNERIAELPINPVRAAARVDNISDLGIEDHIASGSSLFAGSSAGRAENVAVSARNVSFQLVAPGEMFSFNDLLGPISHDNGFVDGSVINGDFAATDIGGGVCQVSTTVFRAAARAGFQFTEWHPHSWRLAFYEADGSPPGFDGAIYQPNNEWEIEMDLRFVNPLDSWLLLQVLIDGETVRAQFYGRPNGWTSEFGEPRLGEPKAIPAPVERVNQNLADGQRVQVQRAEAGVTVRMRRSVTAADGSLVSDGDFVSDYMSIPEVWEVAPS
jgi:vancomycin resistance protein YoaR